LPTQRVSGFENIMMGRGIEVPALLGAAYAKTSSTL
jgi:hypothetical protein